MIHIAILKKEMLDKILRGEKTVESRWYKNKYTPYNKIKKGDLIYFKYTGGFVVAKANVLDVKQFDSLDKNKIENIFNEYGDGIGITKENRKIFFDNCTQKRYCVLVFFDKVVKVKEFNINKKGFGMQCAWLVVDDIKKITRD